MNEKIICYDSHRSDYIIINLDMTKLLGHLSEEYRMCSIVKKEATNMKIMRKKIFPRGKKKILPF